MNILMLAPTFRPASYMGNVGGGEISNRMLLTALVAKGHSVTVATVVGGAQPIAIDNGITIHAATTRTDRLGRVAAFGRFTSFRTADRTCRSIGHHPFGHVGDPRSISGVP